MVKDAKYVALREDIQPTAYLAGSQNANPDQSNTFELYVAAGAPTTVISAHAWVIGNDGDRIESKRLPNAPSRKGHMESTARGATAVWTRVRARGCWWGGERARFAGSAYEEALGINPQLPEAESRLIYLYARLGQSAKAEEHFRAAIRLDPKKSDAYFNYGVLLLGQGKQKEAEQAFRKAVEVNPRYAEAHNNLAYLFEGQGKVPEAVAELRKALESIPEFPQAHFSLGRILAKQGDYRAGISHLLKALSIQDEGSKASYLYAVGVAYSGVGDLENGVRFLRLARAKAAARNDSKLLESIGEDLRLLGGEESPY